MSKTTILQLALVLLIIGGVAQAESVNLSWTAPGDDGQTGTANRYDLRYAEFAINQSNWNQATAVAGLPSPSAAGSPESFTVDGLAAGQTYYFALRTADDALNWSELSNVAVKTVPFESTAPSVVSDLNGITWTQTSVTLAWTAPGDDGNDGTASRYELRYAEFPITVSSWNSAIVAGGLPSPASAGSTETYTVDVLEPGTQYYFAIRTADEVPNWSGISNVAAVTTSPDSPNIPPAGIVDLSGTGATTNSVSLSWTAPGADGDFGVASRYDLRFSTAPINETNWAAAISLEGMASPQPAGSLESYDISGLLPGTVYYFAVKTADEVPQWSALSNLVSVQTLAVFEGSLEITDLSAPSSGLTSVALAWTAPGDGADAASEYDLRFANYAITEANWSTANRVRSLGAPASTGSSERFTVYGLTPNIKYYFALKAADAAGTWSDMSNVTTRTTGAVTEESVPPANIADLEGMAVDENSVTLTWTAPGDDGTTGTAAEYDLRYATEPIALANWSNLERLEGLGGPQPAGSVESYDISGLAPGTAYYFAVRTADEVPNWSGLSNIANAATPDLNIPPGDIRNLAGSEVTDSSVLLTWTAPGCDGNEGQATSYDLAWATAPVSETNWAGAAHLDGLPAPSPAGSAEAFRVTGLQPGFHYYFAMKACDEIDQWSGLSNVVSLNTDAPNQPPTAVLTLAAGATTTHSIALTWTAPADDSGAAALYDLRYALAPISEANWAQASPVADLPVPAAPGTEQTFTVTGLAHTTLYYFALKSADNDGAWSGLSNVVSAETDVEIVAGTDAPADVSDLTCTGTSRISVSLEWTAPGADGTEGTATAYDLRFANFPIDESNFGAANSVLSVKAPNPAGTKEKHTVWALTPGVQYYFAVKTVDEADNWSNTSNVASAVTGQEVLPLAVDFSAAATSGEAPFEVSFTSEVSGEPDTWLWDFGDGTQSAVSNPDHVYEAAGSFTVALTVANASGSVRETKTDFIAVSGSTAAREIHVDAIQVRSLQYKTWCRGYADVHVVDDENQPVEGATVYLVVSGATMESQTSITDETGTAVFKTRVSRNCALDWCYSVTDVIHALLVYNPLSDRVSSTCNSIVALASREEFDWEGAEVPDGFALEQNYPNPFNPSTEISFSLPAPSSVRLVVVNMLGQEVAVLAEGSLRAGWHSVTWDGRTTGGRPVASGLYLYHLQAGEFSESRKMMLLK